MDTYEIIYDYAEDCDTIYDIYEHFTGTWDELQDHLKKMRENGCFHIDATCISGNW